MTNTTKRSIIALLLSLVLVVSLFTVSVFASDSSTAAGELTTEAATEGATEAGEETDTQEETTKKAEAQTESAAQKAEKEAIAEKKQTLIINGIIIAVIILIIAILAVKFRTKLSNFFRSVKSELKKIVWASKENTRKSFLVVVVVALAVALMVWIIDLAFNQGISMLAGLFK